MNLRRQPSAAQLLHQAETRTGCALEMMLRFTMYAQDRETHGRVERWTGVGETWLAVASDQVWLLHARLQLAERADTARRRGHSRASEVGSVWDHLPRRGLTMHSVARRRFHDLDLSWPAQRRLITGRLWGPRSQRDLLVGQLTGDELRHLLGGRADLT